GWSLDLHHAYDPVGGRVYYGHGGRRAFSPAGADAKLSVLLAEKGARVRHRIVTVSGVAVDAEGTVYVADQSADDVYRISPQGGVDLFAGSALGGREPFVEAHFSRPRGLAIGPEGALYVADEF